MQEYKLALFDMDGVLYDSMPLHAIAWVQAMASFDIKFSKNDAYITEGARGVDTVRKYVKEQTGELVSMERAQEMYDHKAAVFKNLGEPILMPGILDVMETLKQKGFTIGVVTGSGQRPLIARILRDFSAYITEDHIVTAYDVTHGKPDPEPYLKGMQKCSLKEVGGERLEVREFKPEETLVIENAPLGVHAGHASGAFTIAVNTGPLPDSDLLSQGADALFQNMHELNQWLKTQ